ncbi:hypothetical protein E4U09_002929 [Claviceps aff. purpurea]|uniref:YTH domain-containing protein n=1 Tax=Claviceps aff. purpurea TaxID=1967640 RepID=A0A9P7U6A3_9HYPO|nr:hypothetical protein E4U09_002929 [Claviceps aff. purpurea]
MGAPHQANTNVTAPHRAIESRVSRPSTLRAPSQSGSIQTNIATTNPTSFSSASSVRPRSNGDDDDDEEEADSTDDLDGLLSDVISVHDDLATWLQHTGFWDVDYRRAMLADVRRLKGLEAERASVLNRIRASKPGITGGDAPALVPIAAAAAASASATAIATAASATATATATAATAAATTATATAATAVAPKSSHTCASAPAACSTNSTVEANLARYELTGPLYRRIAQTPAVKKGTRYFLVKSSTMTNVMRSQQDNLWVTQNKNGSLLAQAFLESKTVVLFFSVNRSKAFQGYAHMTSLPDASIPPPLWITATANDMHTTHPFHIHWVKTAEISFYEFAHLKNALNEHLSVSVGRDGQEYPQDCGRRMVQVMNRVAAAAVAAAAAARAGNKTGMAMTGLDRSKWFRKGVSANPALEPMPMPMPVSVPVPVPRPMARPVSVPVTVPVPVGVGVGVGTGRGMPKGRGAGKEDLLVDLEYCN